MAASEASKHTVGVPQDAPRLEGVEMAGDGRKVSELRQSGGRVSDAPEFWPELPLAAWEETRTTLHMWTQIVGKLSLELCAPINHWWESTLRVTPRGLRTPIMPYGARSLEAEFDFIDHSLVFRSSGGELRHIPLYPRSVADFYLQVTSVLQAMNVEVEIWPVPVEVPDPVPFAEDIQHASYDPQYVRRFHRILLQCDAIFKEFRGRFIGKNSPVHFFWGAFDLASTRFSGRRAPEREGADAVTAEAYSHEVASVGFWPGSGEIKAPAFYSYSAPAPEGYSSCTVKPAQAFYHQGLGEFLLMYDDVRRASSPTRAVLDFLESTYGAAANLGHWDRAALERRSG